jgi:hypothetical protein
MLDRFCNLPVMSKRFDGAVRDMDTASIDPDGRMRLGSQQAAPRVSS